MLFEKSEILRFCQKISFVGLKSKFLFTNKNLRPFPISPVNMKKIGRVVMKWAKLAFARFLFNLTVLYESRPPQKCEKRPADLCGATRGASRATPRARGNFVRTYAPFIILSDAYARATFFARGIGLNFSLGLWERRTSVAFYLTLEKLWQF